MSNNYEMMYVLRPDMSDDRINAAIDKYRDFLAERGATDIQIQVWGRRRLAYEIQRQQDGIYVLVNYKADGQQVVPLERAMRLGEEVIRYLTLRLKDDPANPDAVQEAEPVEAEA
ncbi:30S ribosomal protein S6 [Lusitaniella coriacea LEGE 07157]|uniref:Small ribosomal subunit protein bS6 n=1 Tax=Lusitaniella coriacea LEGE 07157 TaxID=945747 RepID=A0A8J7AX96_9CYAN|nr:30S ribosomal protein S6 [Lusitaniella coriacea]MBE9114329.1 30S ribosomal protein S6 [Lusitaniella coriacea LEGE 07157]